MFVKYAVASFNRHQSELGYRYYFTELVRLYGYGKTYGLSLYETTHKQPQEERTVEEIVSSVAASAGLEVVDEPA